MKGNIVLLLLLLVACGRVGFDEQARGADDAGDQLDGGGDAAPSAVCAGGCPIGAYCAAPLGACGGDGTCMQTPPTCPATFDPVCGCDGTSYDNACAAQRSGVNIMAGGECTSYVSPCVPACAANEYCDTVGCQAPGVCLPEPPPEQQCVDVPVCGCDGITYGNSCDARRAGVDVASSGVCAF